MSVKQPEGMRLILASSSPRRAELMRQAGYVFETIAPPIHEPDETGPGVQPESQAEALSYFKARSVVPQIETGLIVAGDTLVAFEGTTFGKPADADDARRILTRLSGTTHKVITGVTLLDAQTRRRLISHDTTRVTMRAMPAEAMERYLSGGEWRGKAGAYGIQDSGDAFIERMDGSFSNVVGLPMELLATLLAHWRDGADPEQSEQRPMTVENSGNPPGP